MAICWQEHYSTDEEEEEGKMSGQSEEATDRALAERSPIVYFDGSCPLCSAEIAFYRRHVINGEVAFHDVSQRTDEQIAPDLTRSEAMARFHVRGSDGALSSGAAGFVALWAAIPRFEWLGRVGRLPGVTPLLEVGYRLFLPVRPLLSKIVRFWGRRQAA